MNSQLQNSPGKGLYVSSHSEDDLHSHNSTGMDQFNERFEKFTMLVRQLQNDLPAPTRFGLRLRRVFPSFVFVLQMQGVFH